MGLTFRKGFKLGPVRVNLSRSGIGYSIGALGLRFGTTARGGRYATANLPLGFSYRKSLPGSKRRAKAVSPLMPHSPFPGGIVDLSGGDEFWFNVDGETRFQGNIIAAANDVERHGGTEPIIPVFLARIDSRDIGVIVRAGHSYLEAGTVLASSPVLRTLADRLGDDEPSVGRCLALIFDEDGQYGLKLNIDRDLAD